jgi:hypothetical protein
MLRTLFYVGEADRPKFQDSMESGELMSGNSDTNKVQILRAYEGRSLL